MARFIEPTPPYDEPDLALFCSECGGELTDQEIAANDQDDAAEDERLCNECHHVRTVNIN